MILLLTGASGLVGGAVARAAQARGWEVIGTIHRQAAHLGGKARTEAVDLQDATALQALLERVQPDAIVNTAALSEPAHCEADPAGSAELNVEMPARLATFAAVSGARLVHISSDQVFDGTRSPYRTGDEPVPLSLYGRQKRESELRVRATAPHASATVRAPLLMGNSPGSRRSIHERLFAEWVEGRTPRLFVDEFRQSCTADNLAEALLDLCAAPQLCGVFHWGGVEVLSRYAQGARIREHFGLDTSCAPLAELRRAEVPSLSAARPANLALSLEPLDTAIPTQPQTFAEQLDTLHVPPWAAQWHRSHADG